MRLCSKPHGRLVRRFHAAVRPRYAGPIDRRTVEQHHNRHAIGRADRRLFGGRSAGGGLAGARRNGERKWRFRPPDAGQRSRRSGKRCQEPFPWNKDTHLCEQFTKSPKGANRGRTPPRPEPRPIPMSRAYWMVGSSSSGAGPGRPAATPMASMADGTSRTARRSTRLSS